jgi:FkbM family methyltransferase
MTHGGQPTICLAMVISDEIDALAECLASCRDLIDRWLICDTGSRGEAERLIREALPHVPGELHPIPAGLREHARETLMALAREAADYLLLLEPNWVIDATREQFENLTADAYLARVAADGEGEEREILIRGGLDRSSAPTAGRSDARHTERLEGVAVRAHASRGGNLETLKDTVARDPQDAGAVFALARAHHLLADEIDDDDRRRLALEWYRRRAAMPGWAEETYCAWLQAGVLSERLGDWPAAVDAYMRAWEARPERLESVHALAVGLRVRGLHRAQHRFAGVASGLRPLPIPPDLLLVARWIYEWGLLFEYSISAYWCGDYDASIAACTRLLEIDGLPDDYRADTRRNLNHAAQAKVRERVVAPATIRRMMPPGTPTWGYRGHDRLTPAELRAPGLARRLAELCSMTPQAVDRRLLGLGPPLEINVIALAPWPLRVRPGTSDVALIDTVCNGTTHLPPAALDAPDLIVDLGAQVGITALDLARRYPSAHLVAVEMDAESLGLCSHNLAPLAERATLVGAAIAAADGSAAYSTAGDPAHHALAADGEAETATITLDTLLEHSAAGKVVDYLKMNIEGSEQAVLGAGGSWPASVRSITVIAHGSYGAGGAVEDLRRLGFAIVAEHAQRVCGTRADARPSGARRQRTG